MWAKKRLTAAVVLFLLCGMAPAFAEPVKTGAAKKPAATTAAKAKGAAKKAMTEDRAVAIVSARPEVKKFIANIKASKIKGTSSHIEFDRKEGDEFVIHVYEYVPDDAESGHTATFNWYHVNAKSGKVTTEF